jgi:hypothetical protein
MKEHLRTSEEGAEVVNGVVYVGSRDGNVYVLAACFREAASALIRQLH